MADIFSILEGTGEGQLLVFYSIDRGSLVAVDGQLMDFWKDAWLGDTPLSLQYLSLYNIAPRKDASVAAVLEASPLNIQFLIVLTGDKLTS